MDTYHQKISRNKEKQINKIVLGMNNDDGNPSPVRNIFFSSLIFCTQMINTF